MTTETPALPNTVYVGLPRAGSTWLFQVLNGHPDIWCAPSKDLYFFDRYHDLGLDWYRRQFIGGAGSPVRLELSHDYFHSPSAARRMQDTIPDARILVSLRDPVDWLASTHRSHLMAGTIKHDFETWIPDAPIGRTLYSRYLAHWHRLFGAENVHVVLFDDIRSRPEAVVAGIEDFLGIRRWDGHQDLHEAANAGGMPRSRVVVRTGKAVVAAARRHGRPDAARSLRSFGPASRLLYRPVDAAHRRVPDTFAADLRAFLRDDRRALSDLLSRDLDALWGDT